MRSGKATHQARWSWMPKLSAAQEHQFEGVVEIGEHSTPEIANLMGVRRATIYRAIEPAQR